MTAGSLDSLEQNKVLQQRFSSLFFQYKRFEGFVECCAHVLPPSTHKEVPISSINIVFTFAGGLAMLLLLGPPCQPFPRYLQYSSTVLLYVP